MKTAEEILKETIESYNSSVNDIGKFRFNQRESQMFATMMKEYATEAIKADRERIKSELLKCSLPVHGGQVIDASNVQIIAGKANREFIKWLFEVHNLHPYNVFNDILCNALIIEWLDSVGIYIEVYPDIITDPIPYSYHIKSKCHKGTRIVKHYKDHYHASRNDATSAAITKAIELFNERE